VRVARRNLTPFQRAELALKLEPIYAKRAKRQQGKRNDLPQNSAEGFAPVDAREELAKHSGLSTDTISRAKVIDRHADEQTKEKLRRGETTTRKEQQPAGTCPRAVTLRRPALNGKDSPTPGECRLPAL
jgi:hypothetical protein